MSWMVDDHELPPLPPPPDAAMYDDNAAAEMSGDFSGDEAMGDDEGAMVQALMMAGVTLPTATDTSRSILKH